MHVGVYAWIGINFVLGRFEHTDDGKYLNCELDFREDFEYLPVLSPLILDRY